MQFLPTEMQSAPRPITLSAKRQDTEYTYRALSYSHF